MGNEIMYGFIGFVLGVLLLSWIIWVSPRDLIYLDGLGEYMCDEHNLGFEKVEFKEDSLSNIEKFKVYCLNETKIDDGYLVII